MNNEGAEARVRPCLDLPFVLGGRVHSRMKLSFSSSFKARIHGRVATDVMARFRLSLYSQI